MKAAEQISLPGGAGYTLPVNWYPAESARGSLILMAAAVKEIVCWHEKNGAENINGGHNV